MPTPSEIFDALVAAQKRGAIATSLDTAGIRTMAAEIRAGSVFTAHGTSTIFAQQIKDVVDAITGDRIGESEGIARLMDSLRVLGYKPETGFPGFEGMVPAAEAGSIQDIGSYRRLELIIRTQVDLMTGRGEQMRGHTPAALEASPAWELIRVLPVENSREWYARWTLAGGRSPVYPISSLKALRERTGMIAMKGDPVWGELGASENFDDALDVDHPPFAFRSGMGWREVSREECEALKITGPDGEGIDDWFATRPITLAGQMDLPAPKLSMRDVSPELLDHFKAATGAVQVEGSETLYTAPINADGSKDFTSDLLAQARAKRDATRAARKAGAA